jgi:hypothetical protein
MAARCGHSPAARRRALHPNLEGEPAVGEDLRHHRKTCEPHSSTSPLATTKLGSSLGTANRTPSTGASRLRTGILKTPCVVHRIDQAFNQDWFCWRIPG